MPEYITVPQLTAYITETAKKHIADRDRSGVVSAAESAAVLESAVAWAGSVIDFSIVGFCPVETARAQAAAGTCPWLADRCKELASYRASTTGGASAPESFEAAFNQANLWLLDVRQNQSPIPGLIVPRPRNGGCGHVGVMVVNPR